MDTVLGDPEERVVLFVGVGVGLVLLEAAGLDSSVVKVGIEEGKGIVDILVGTIVVIEGFGLGTVDDCEAEAGLCTVGMAVSFVDNGADDVD